MTPVRNDLNDANETGNACISGTTQARSCIASVVDTDEVRSDVQLIWIRTYLRQNLCETEFIWHWTYLILNLFCSELIRYLTFQVLSLSNTELLITSMVVHWSTQDQDQRTRGHSERGGGEGDEFDLFRHQFRYRGARRGWWSSWTGRVGGDWCWPISSPVLPQGALREGWRSVWAGRGKRDWGKAFTSPISQ
jgi:hypothetical protein